MATANGLKLPLTNRELALQCATLSRKGLGGAAMRDELGLDSRERALALAGVGARIEEIENSALTASEQELVKAVAMAELWLRGREEVRSANAADVGWWVGRGSGWAASVARRRFLADDCPPHRKLIWKAGGCNGAIALTPLGWTVALVLLSEADIERTQPRKAAS